MAGDKELIKVEVGERPATSNTGVSITRSPDHPITRLTDRTVGASEEVTRSPDAAGLVCVTFLPGNRRVEFELDRLPYAEHGKERSILDVALNFGIDLDHACGGACACTTCHVVVKKGEEFLSAMEDDEADKLDTAADLTLHSRLGCQAQIVRPGEIVVEIPAWNRNFARE
jgi:2Fe-2S ferredoxin